jgi:DNA-binding transcriptional LysR family regulator
VENDQADLGLVSYPKASRTIKAIPWREEPMVLVCSPNHAFAKRQRVSLEEVAAQPIIGFDAELTIRREIDRVLQEYHTDLSVVMEFDNIETIKRAVEIDAGVSLLPAPTVVREVETGSLVAVPLATNELVRPLGIVHRRGKDLGVTVRRFIDLLRREADQVDSQAKQKPRVYEEPRGSSLAADREANGNLTGNGHSGREDAARHLVGQG